LPCPHSRPLSTDNDLSIPDQRRQAKGYCTSGGWEIVADYVEPDASGQRAEAGIEQQQFAAGIDKTPGEGMFVTVSIDPVSLREVPDFPRRGPAPSL